MAGKQIRVIFADGHEDNVTIKMGDTLHYSYVWKKNGWPSPTEDQMLAGVYAVFAACRRERKFVGSWEAFNDAVDAVEGLAAVDPTAPASPPAMDYGEPMAPPPAETPGVPAEDTAPPTQTPTDPTPPAMSPQEPAPIGSTIEAGHSMTSPSVTTMTPSGDSSRHSL